jgi:hypothetical protein
VAGGLGVMVVRMAVADSGVESTEVRMAALAAVEVEMEVEAMAVVMEVLAEARVAAARVAARVMGWWCPWKALQCR